ncbi:exopolysaccharide biosynthesis polyprenyl glycosylphosphotransferase [Microvirga soli]|uniref:exopolysaccharide biosynthesis polyprenyl glycosylphosphotransferase n=1 Tax=Microvirga soli TaxID=1854496 RepID=UPI00191FBB57|nr:exopolysaccharide biosynthesis polyprenyl glycosylphosphotransferase [Microvirga soli]
MRSVRHAELIEPSALEDVSFHSTPARNQRISVHWYTAALFFSDVIILFSTGVLPILLYDGISDRHLNPYMSAVGSCTLLFLLASRTLAVYDVDKSLDWHWSIPRLIAALTITFVLAMMIGVATKTTEDYSRVWFFSWVSLSFVLITSLRALVLAAVEAKLTKGAYLKQALIITCSSNAFSEDQLAIETRNRVRAVGTILAQDVAQIPDLMVYIQRLKPDVVIFNLPWPQVEEAISKFNALSHHALEVLILPDASICLQRAIRLRRFGSRALLQILEPPLAEWERTIKRIEDIVVASVALFVTMPLLIITAIAIKMESKGEVLFKQPRTGLDGEIIDVWKFRSMYVEVADRDASRQTSKNDPRVTRIGRFIRKTSIDELPQFWNVLQGQMSVVGPRPHALKTAAEGKTLEALVDDYGARHRVKPGITGWAQINGARGELFSRHQVKKRVDYDLYYIENWSVLFDIKIILMTVVRVFYDPHAY